MIRLIVLGVVAFLAFVLVTLPASVITGRLERFGVQTEEVQGSVWNGTAAMLRYRGTPLGQLQWQVHPLSLFGGRLRLDAHLLQSESQSLRSALSLAPGGRMRFENLQGTFPLSLLSTFGVAGSWSGSARLNFTELTLLDGWPAEASGTLELHDLQAPTAKRQSLGGFRATFPASAAQSAAAAGLASGAGGAGQDSQVSSSTGNPSELVGALNSLEGPLDLAGVLKLSRNRGYVVEGRVAAKPGAPQDMAQMIEYFGTPDAQGRRPFSLAGTL